MFFKKKKIDTKEKEENRESYKILFKNHLKKANVELNDHEINCYVNLFIVLRKLSNNKLSMKEIIDMYDLFSDIAVGNRVDLAYFETKDAIKGLYRYFESYTVTKGKLSDLEKEQLAFAIYYALFIRVYDDEAEKVTWSLGDFESYDKIISLYEEEKEANPQKFVVNNEETNNSNKDYGYDMNNPIEFTCIPEMYIYLDSLVTCDNHNISYDRDCSVTNDNDVLVDQFIIIDEVSNKEYILYFSEYGNDNSNKYPEGFKKIDEDMYDNE